MKTIVESSTNALLALLAIGGAIYFFEDLPMQIEVEHIGTGQACYYQSGILHTTVANFECNALHIGEFHAIDAAQIYHLACCH